MGLATSSSTANVLGNTNSADKGLRIKTNSGSGERALRYSSLHLHAPEAGSNVYLTCGAYNSCRDLALGTQAAPLIVGGDLTLDFDVKT